MNQTTIRRQRLSASIAAAALRDPSTAEILRETGFAGAGLLVSTYDPSKKTIPADLEDFSGDSPPPFFDARLGWLVRFRDY